jgi:hypothetical protein
LRITGWATIGLGCLFGLLALSRAFNASGAPCDHSGDYMMFGLWLMTPAAATVLLAGGAFIVAASRTSSSRAPDLA